MTSESFEVVHNQPDARFEIDLGGTAAFLAYEVQGGRIVMQHTQVPEEFGGKGLGGLLARYALDYARDNNLKVVPRCPFVASYITRHPEYEAITEREV